MLRKMTMFKIKWLVPTDFAQVFQKSQRTLRAKWIIAKKKKQREELVGYRRITLAIIVMDLKPESKDNLEPTDLVE